MKDSFKFDYFYGSQAEQFSFFRLPKILIRDERFKKISSDAKILYGIMLDRMSLSRENKWMDQNNRVYIIFTLKEVMVIDEVENHFNKEIVITLIRFFMDSKLNKNGGTLIFSTHYPELLDEYDRNDSIFITRNRNGITVENLSNILKRNDIKKSDAYQSGFLEGTTPTYEAYMRLKKSIALALM